MNTQSTLNSASDLISRLQDEADLCRSDGADDIASLLDEAVAEIQRLQRLAKSNA